MAITAFMLDEVTEQCMQAGMDAVYAKPIMQTTLETIIAKALKKPSSTYYIGKKLKIAQ